jgi:hypothetical protein
MARSQVMIRPAFPVLLGLLAGLAAVTPACGDNDTEAPEDVLARLRALDGVTVEALCGV